MEQAILKKIFNKGRTYRMYPSRVEAWYQTNKGDYLVISLSNSKRSIFFHNERIIQDMDNTSGFDVTEVDDVWDKFYICPHILFDRDNVVFNNIHWKNGNELFGTV